MNKDKIKIREEEILKLSKEFCAQHLNQEYALLVEKLHKKLTRKRDKPMKAGKVEIWATAIVHALGGINFLYDRASEPYITVKALNDWFGTKTQTTGNKAGLIRKMFDLHYFHPEYSLGAVKASNPMEQLVMVDGIMIPLNTLNAELQEMVREVRSRGEDISFTSQ